MQAAMEVSAPTESGRDSARPTQVAGGVLLLLMVVTAIPVVRLALVGLDPAQGLVEGVRLPAGLPRLGPPFGQHAASPYWMAETAGALVLLATFLARSLSARRRPGRGRVRVFAQVWLDTVLATLLGWLVAAVAVSFLTADRWLSYLLLVGGTVVFAVALGAAAGLLTGVVAALAHRRQPTATAAG